MATCRGAGQESAEAIIGVGKQARQTGKDLPCRRAKHREVHLSRTLATQTGMTNKRLKDQGLLSVKELGVHIHYPATAR